MRTPVAAILIATLVAAPIEAQTRVLRATSSTIRLQPGTAAVPLTIEGQNMTSISSVRVMLNGRPVSGVTTAIKQATATQLVVELTAAPEVAAGSYTIELLAGRQRIAVPTSIVSVDIASTRLRQALQPVNTTPRLPAPSPPVITANPSTIVLGPRESGDIVLNGSNLDAVTSAHVVDGAGRLVYHVRAELQRGTATSRTVRLIVPDNPNQRGPFGTPMTIVVSTEPGTSIATQGRVEVRPTYDLYISSCRIEPLPTFGYYKGFVSITNHGINTIAASLPGRATIATYNSHPEYSGYAVILAPGGGLYLAPGQTWTYEIGSITFPNPAPRTMSIKLTPRDDERNHANSEATCSIPTHPAPAPPPAPSGQADLVVSQVVVTPASGPPSTQFVVTVTVRNQGNGAVSLPTTGSGPAVRCTIPDQRQSFHELEPGQTKSFTFRITYPLPPGPKETVCTVDPLPQDVTESNENNNTRSATFTVTDPGGM